MIYIQNTTIRIAKSEIYLGNAGLNRYFSKFYLFLVVLGGGGGSAFNPEV
jgi:hypothetical protein